MVFVVGRGTDSPTERPAGRLGTYRALDGSDGAPLYLDFETPHAVLVVGKRGYGKSYTLGVIAEELARTDGVAPVLLDPMGVFRTMTEGGPGNPVPARCIDSPVIPPDALDPKSWCLMLELAPDSGAGSLVWKGAQEAPTIDAMQETIRESEAPEHERRSACNHLDLAASWGIFDPDGLDASTLGGGEITVLDISGLDSAPMNAVCRGVGESLYRARVDSTVDRLPWLLVDEAHTFFEGIAASALKKLLTRGRAPGVSLVTATQRPSAVPAVGISQADILISHRLTAQDDIDALTAAQPTYLNRSLDERMPTEPGAVAIIDDATETVHAAQIRPRDTPHGGDSPRASRVCLDGSAASVSGKPQLRDSRKP